MHFEVKSTTMLDGVKVVDVNLKPNGHAVNGRKIAIFTCRNKTDAFKFVEGLEFLIKKYTVEVMDVTYHKNLTEEGK